MGVTQAISIVHGTAVEVVKTEPIVESSTYYFVGDDNPIHEDDWAAYGEVDDFWSYKFKYNEEVLLDYYLGEADLEEIERVCSVLVLGDASNHKFHHALYCILKEFR